MNNSTFNYVRTHRQRRGLSEDELAFLMNLRSHGSVSQFERGDRVPSLEGALALQVLFRQTARQMFPEFFEWVEDGVMRRAAHLIEQLGEAADTRSTVKREFLEGLASEDNDIEV